MQIASRVHQELQLIFRCTEQAYSWVQLSHTKPVAASHEGFSLSGKGSCSVMVRLLGGTFTGLQCTKGTPTTAHASALHRCRLMRAAAAAVKAYMAKLLGNSAVLAVNMPLLVSRSRSR